jgi:pimeloyl-ACP methyl ester carboxylesterase
MTSTSRPLPIPDGPGSVAGVPHLPDGFQGMFASRYIDTGDVRLHAVIGGEGPPLLLVHGWPESWYAWRLVMPALARDFQVIAVDQRGMGLSDMPQDGYDAATLANDLGRARPRPLRRRRPRHRDGHRLRAGRGPSRSARPSDRRRDHTP